ncbi:hypothetical protein LTR53_008365 [Teratosphaeriaceae sp. CCFEE 6253]|nr:hypothetical protein LTR53_008365 [Teratosphaeriaceae sp. CCFEE 6253]
MTDRIAPDPPTQAHEVAAEQVRSNAEQGQIDSAHQDPDRRGESRLQDQAEQGAGETDLGQNARDPLAAEKCQQAEAEGRGTLTADTPTAVGAKAATKKQKRTSQKEDKAKESQLTLPSDSDSDCYVSADEGKSGPEAESSHEAEGEPEATHHSKLELVIETRQHCARDDGKVPRPLSPDFQSMQRARECADTGRTSDLAAVTQGSAPAQDNCAAVADMVDIRSQTEMDAEHEEVEAEGQRASSRASRKTDRQGEDICKHPASISRRRPKLSPALIASIREECPDFKGYLFSEDWWSLHEQSTPQLYQDTLETLDTVLGHVDSILAKCRVDGPEPSSARAIVAQFDQILTQMQTLREHSSGELDSAVAQMRDMALRHRADSAARIEHACSCLESTLAEFRSARVESAQQSQNDLMKMAHSMLWQETKSVVAEYKEHEIQRLAKETTDAWKADWDLQKAAMMAEVARTDSALREEVAEMRLRLDDQASGKARWKVELDHHVLTSIAALKTIDARVIECEEWQDKFSPAIKQLKQKVAELEAAAEESTAPPPKSKEKGRERKR